MTTAGERPFSLIMHWQAFVRYWSSTASLEMGSAILCMLVHLLLERMLCVEAGGGAGKGQA